jgi:transposase-like protein
MGKRWAKRYYRNMSQVIFHKEFRTEQDCYNWLFKSRWPEGFRCPICGGKEYGRISTRELYQCKSCRKQISLTSGTIFHKTRVPLLKWFMLIHRMASSKTGVSINEMRRELEIKDYKTVWVMAHKIRKAMADRDARYSLSGLVELDESFFGPAGSEKRGRGAEKKQLVIIAVSGWQDTDGTERPGFAHAFAAEDASAETMETLLRRLGIPDPQVQPLITAIRTDGWRSYETVAEKLGLIHYRAVLSNPKDASKILPWTHQLIGNAKAVFSGPHRGVSRKHLQRYLSEVCYRFNRRFWNRETFDRLLTACVSTDTVSRDELMAARS